MLDKKYVNECFCMDNLELLKQLPDNSVDLIYCDILYNTGRRFKDYDDNLGTPLQALEWYKPRVIEMKRVLKNTGSICIHCDWHINSYIRILLDKILGCNNFRNEIIWKRSNDTGSSKAKGKKLPVCSDTILFYSKSDDYKYHMPTIPYDEKMLKRFKYDDNDGKGLYYWENLRTYSEKRLKELGGRNELKQRSSGKYSYKRYLKDCKLEKAISNIWDDIPRLTAQNKESCDYFSQKPQKLLERIIKMTTDSGDIVADFFCGSGTTGVAAKKLNRGYILCDINLKAIEKSKKRLEELK